MGTTRRADADQLFGWPTLAASKLILATMRARPTSNGWMASCGTWKIGIGDGPCLAVSILQLFERKVEQIG